MLLNLSDNTLQGEHSFCLSALIHGISGRYGQANLCQHAALAALARKFARKFKPSCIAHTSKGKVRNPQ
jgi:hypothetical protein